MLRYQLDGEKGDNLIKAFIYCTGAPATDYHPKACGAGTSTEFRLPRIPEGPPQPCYGTLLLNSSFGKHHRALLTRGGAGGG